MQPHAYTQPLTNVMDLLVDAICVVDAEGRFLFVSAASERIFGYLPEELIGRNMIDLVHPDDRERTLQQAGQVMQGQPQPHFENRYVRKDGSVVHIMWSARWSAQDRVRVAVARDITERKHAETMQQALYAISEAAHAAADLVALFERVHQIVGGLLPARNFFVALHDAARDELSFPYFVDAFDPAPAPRPLDSGTLSAEVIRRGEALLLRSDDPASMPLAASTLLGQRPHDWLGVPLATQKGVIGALVVQSYTGDVSYGEEDRQLLQFVSTQVASAVERKQNESRLQHMARHDQLTDLPNRELFRDRLQHAVARAHRDGERLALLYIDLDQFKPVNDNHGHAIGDQLLHEVAGRTRRCLRESDTVGRLGGDEFAVLLHRVALPAHAAMVAEKIRSELCRPFEIEGLSVQVAASIGVALYPHDAVGVETLLKHADDAMYAAKKLGGNRWSGSDELQRDHPPGE